MEGWGDARTEPGFPGSDAGLGAERRGIGRGFGTGTGRGVDCGVDCGSGRRAVRRTRRLPAQHYISGYFTLKGIFHFWGGDL